MKARPFAAIAVGDTTTWSHEITAAEVDAFAELSGDVNPLHLDDDFARQHGFRSRVVHGMLLASFLSRVLGTLLPGPGVLWLGQDTKFHAPAHVGDEIEIAVTITFRSEALRTLVLRTVITNGRGEQLLTGEAKTMLTAAAQEVAWSEMGVIVTGASRGIGAAIATAFGARGAQVAVNYRSDAEAAEGVAAAITQAGGRAITVKADVTEPEATVRLAREATEAFGRVDVVVSNATPAIVRKPLEELSWEDFDGYWNAYVRSAFLLAQAVLPGMKERGYGRMVHLLTSAIWGTPPPGTAAYVAAKSGLWGLAKSMAVECAPHGITVNAVSPSAVLTDQWRDESASRRRALTMSVPARRLPSPAEVAGAVVFLASSEAGYLTGANVPVAGGEVM